MEEIKLNISTNSLTIVYFFICITTVGFLLMILVEGLRNLLFKDKKKWKENLKNLELQTESFDKILSEKVKEHSIELENECRIAKGEYERKLSKIESIFYLIAKLNNLTPGFTNIQYHNIENLYLEKLSFEDLELLIDKSCLLLNHYYENEYKKNGFGEWVLKIEKKNE